MVLGSLKVFSFQKKAQLYIKNLDVISGDSGLPKPTLDLFLWLWKIVVGDFLSIYTPLKSSKQLVKGLFKAFNCCCFKKAVSLVAKSTGSGTILPGFRY